MLFGAIVASAATALVTHYALCDRDGAPACGNIGQAGAKLPPPAPTTISLNVTAQTAPLVQTSVTQKLVAPAPTGPVIPAVARPLVTADGDVAAGNVMSKGGGRQP